MQGSKRNCIRSGGIFGIVLLIAGAVSAGLAVTGAAQTNSRFLVFDVAGSVPYSVTKNSLALTSISSSTAGVVEFATGVTTGDIFVIAADTTTNTQPPTPPYVLEAAQEGIGCLRVAWLPSGDPSVTGYVVSYGTRPFGVVGAYDHTVDAGNATTYEICELQLGPWYVAVRARNYAGQLSAYSDEQTVVMLPTAAGGVPISDVELLQNNPNPFNPSTTISYLLPETETVRLVVYDVRGREVVVLTSGLRPAGRHDIRWDGRNRVGEAVSSGVYYYRLQTGNRTLVRKMLLLK
jgi:hypothetical protein